MQESLPNSVTSFEKKHTAVWEAFAKLGEACHETGPLDEKTRRLVKLALAIAFRSEGAVHSAVRKANAAGASKLHILIFGGYQKVIQTRFSSFGMHLLDSYQKCSYLRAIIILL